jgi:diacylglycerol kinase family enzyme
MMPVGRRDVKQARSGYVRGVTRRYHVFINKEAGSGEADQKSSDISNEFRNAGVEATVVAVDPRRLHEQMREAWSRGTDAIVIAGGDGTVSLAAGVAVESSIVLGVLPMGTFNHFAKDLGMPDDLAGAVLFLVQADVVDVDVGQVNGKIFVNNASIGVYPKMVGEREDIRRRRGWGKVRAAPVAIMHALRRLPVHRLRLKVDDSAPVDITTPLLFIGNGLFDERGERVGQRASLTDHRLGAYAIVTSSRWKLITSSVRARVGGIDAAAQMQHHTGKTLVVDSDEALELALDGEPTDLRVPLNFQSCAGALRVLAARPSSPRNGRGAPLT